MLYHIQETLETTDTHAQEINQLEQKFDTLSEELRELKEGRC